MMRATITHCGDAYELPQRLQRLFGGTTVHFCGASDASCGLHQVEVEIDEADREIGGPFTVEMGCSRPSTKKRMWPRFISWSVRSPPKKAVPFVLKVGTNKNCLFFFA